MEWQKLPGNYDDLQQELEHLSSSVEAIKTFMEQYVQQEVTFRIIL